MIKSYYILVGECSAFLASGSDPTMLCTICLLRTGDDTDIPSDPPFAGWARISNVKPADPLNLGENQHLREICKNTGK